MNTWFERMNLRYFDRAHFFTGSISQGVGKPDFRYRYEQVEDGKALKASTYSEFCYEKAHDVEERVFPWDENGVEEMKQWYQAQYEAFCKK